MGHEKNGIFPPNVGSLYSIGNDFKLKKQISPVSISNGLAWNPNNDIFYYIDSLSYQIMAYNYNSQTGIICKKFIIYQYNIFYVKFTFLILFFIANKKIVFDFLKNNIPGLPDGMTIDTNGNLWVAVYGGGGVSIFTYNFYYN